MAQRERRQRAHVENGVQFLALLSGGSHLSVIMVPGNPTPSSFDLCGYSHICDIQSYTHIMKIHICVYMYTHT